ncbi:MAG: hypothetical protein HQK51_04050 [Oligoflexia bacterium]|nr:hypothetical protein [Oligoflexia bacterium]
MVAKKKTTTTTTTKKKVVTKKAAPVKKVATKKAAAPVKKVATKKAAAPVKKVATKKAAAPAVKKTVKKAPTKRKPNEAFMKPLMPSEALAAIVGASPLPRTEVVKKLWAYIKKHSLQDQKNRKNINADDKLLEVFDGKKTVSMFEMTKYVSKHLS